MKKNTIKKKKIRKDCWNLDKALYLWLKDRLPTYLKDAEKVVNLENYKFEIDGETRTEKEVIQLMIADLETLTSSKADEYSKEYIECYDHFIGCFTQVLPYLWW